MGLIAPLFLLGALAIALPIWLHRLQTQSSERKAFSSAMLLETARQQVHVRKKLKFLLLLAARIALISLLVLTFAKPFMTVSRESVIATASGTHLVVIDTSVSMGREGVFSQARAEARRALDDAPGDALLQVIGADASLHMLSELNTDKAAQWSAVAASSPGALRLDYGEMMTGIERLVASLPQPVTVHFVSDYQASAMPVRFSDLVPAGVAGFIPHVVGTGEPFNWSIDYVRETVDGLDVGVTAAGDRERVADLKFVLNGETQDTRSLIQTGPQVVHFDIAEFENGENRIEIQLTTDDDLQADNQWYHVVDNAPPEATPLMTLNPGALPYTYLSAALESAGAYAVESLLAGEFDARILSRYRWAVIDDIGLVDPQLEQSLIEFMAAGGNLLAFAGARAAALESLPVSGHRHSATSTRDRAGEFLSIGQIDMRHPVLSQTDGWHSVNVARSMPLVSQDGDEVLIRLDNNEPFLIERRVGDGRLLLMPANLDNQWSDLPLRPVFVSFIIEAGRYLSGVNEIARTYTTGAVLPLGLTGASSGQVVDPDGETVLSLADTTREQQVKLNKAGIYEVYTPQGEMMVAANIDPLESDLRKLGQEVLDRWQDSTGAQAYSAAVTLDTDDSETVELWQWVLLFLALVVIGESLIGNAHLAPRRA